jgi:hypothetical protein
MYARAHLCSGSFHGLAYKLIPSNIVLGNNGGGKKVHSYKVAGRPPRRMLQFSACASLSLALIIWELPRSQLFLIHWARGAHMRVLFHGGAQWNCNKTSKNEFPYARGLIYDSRERAELLCRNIKEELFMHHALWVSNIMTGRRANNMLVGFCWSAERGKATWGSENCHGSIISHQTSQILNQNRAFFVWPRYVFTTYKWDLQQKE